MVMLPFRSMVVPNSYDMGFLGWMGRGEARREGYPDIFIRMLAWVIFLGFKNLNFNIFGGFQKNKYFFGMKILWIFFWGHHKIGLYLGLFLCILGSSFNVIVQNGDIFGLLKFQMFFWGAWNSWYFLGVKGRCWAGAYIWRKIESTPPPPPPPPWGEANCMAQDAFILQHLGLMNIYFKGTIPTAADCDSIFKNLFSIFSDNKAWDFLFSVCLMSRHFKWNIKSIIGFIK